MHANNIAERAGGLSIYLMVLEEQPAELSWSRIPSNKYQKLLLPSYAIIFSCAPVLCVRPIAFANCVVKEWIPPCGARTIRAHWIICVWKVYALSLWEALITLMPQHIRMQHFKDVAMRGFQYAILHFYWRFTHLLLYHVITFYSNSSTVTFRWSKVQKRK
jgi:hypothetical protein